MSKWIDVYVDPAVANGSGTGTIEDPYGSLEQVFSVTMYGWSVHIKDESGEYTAKDWEKGADWQAWKQPEGASLAYWMPKPDPAEES